MAGTLSRGFLSMLGVLGGRRQTQPATVPTDEVVPVHLFDDTRNNRNFAMHWTLRFNDVLDADKLHDALVRLVHIGDWKKLGGRLRKNAAGKLELHIPSEFTSSRRAVNYTHVTLASVPIASHPLGSQLPRAGAGQQQAAMFPGLDAFFPLVLGAGTPTSIDDHVFGDVPQLSLHVVTFADATLATLSWQHTLMDGMGRAALVRAWCLVLAGREAEVPPLEGLRTDPLDGLGMDEAESVKAGRGGAVDGDGSAGAAAPAPEPLLLAHKELRGWSMLAFGLRYYLHIAWRPAMDSRTLFIPAAAMQRLKARATAGLASAALRQPSTGPAFVSEGDVLTAWISRCVACGSAPSAARASPTSRAGRRTVMIQSLFELRSRLPQRFRPGAVYVQNLVTGSYALPPIGLVGRDDTLAATAAAVRRAVVEQSTPPQIEAQIRVQRRAMVELQGSPTLFGDGGALLVSVTNWTKMGFMQSGGRGEGDGAAALPPGAVDFGPAVVKVGAPFEVDGTATERANAVGRPENGMMYIRKARQIAVVMGKDAAGNYWLTGFFIPKVWAAFERELKELGKSE